jgi:hypothetical protein
MQALAVNADSSGPKLPLLNGRDQVVKTADLPVCSPVPAVSANEGTQDRASSPDRAVSRRGGPGE